jgi:uncharacterized RDD family membrane protein YckC
MGSANDWKFDGLVEKKDQENKDSSEDFESPLSRNAQKIAERKQYKSLEVAKSAGKIRGMRSQVRHMANMANDEVDEHGDLKEQIILAEGKNRLLAGLLDLMAFFGLLFIISKFWMPLSTIEQVRVFLSQDLNLRDILYQKTSGQSLLTLYVWLGAYLLVFIIPLAMWGVSFGKVLFKIRVKRDGSFVSLGFFKAITREVLGKILFSPLIIVSLSWMFFSKKRQTIHDRLTKTIVVKI